MIIINGNTAYLYLKSNEKDRAVIIMILRIIIVKIGNKILRFLHILYDPLNSSEPDRREINNVKLFNVIYSAFSGLEINDGTAPIIPNMTLIIVFVIPLNGAFPYWLSNCSKKLS